MNLYFVELQNFGWNMMTLGLLGTIVFGLLQSFGLLHQKKVIEEEQSVESVSVLSHQYFSAYFLYLVIYGLRHGLLAFVCSGIMLGIMNTVVFKTAVKNGSKRSWDRHVLWLIATVVCASMLAYPYDTYLIWPLYLIATLILWSIPWNMYSAGTVGSVSGRMLCMVLCSISFWAIFSYKMKDWFLFWNCIGGITAVLWALYLCVTFSFQEEMDEMNEDRY